MCIYNNRLKRWNGFANRPLIDDLQGLSISLCRKITCKIRGTLELGVLVTMANDLDDLILILQGKSFLAVINANEEETDETLLEAEAKGNGGILTLFNLKDAVILYELRNSLWLLQMISLETFIELNVDSDIKYFRFRFIKLFNLNYTNKQRAYNAKTKNTKNIYKNIITHAMNLMNYFKSHKVVKITTNTK